MKGVYDTKTLVYDRDNTTIIYHVVVASCHSQHLSTRHNAIYKDIADGSSPHPLALGKWSRGVLLQKQDYQKQLLLFRATRRSPCALSSGGRVEGCTQASEQQSGHNHWFLKHNVQKVACGCSGNFFKLISVLPYSD